MDNGFLTTLFYILLIVVFVSSLFKKPKGKRGTTAPRRPTANNEDADLENDIVYTEDNKDKNDNNEILDEIADLFREPNFKSETPAPVPARKETKIETYSRQKGTTAEQDEYSKWPGYQAYDTAPASTVLKTVQNEIKQVDNQIEKEAQAFEKLLNAKQEESHYFTELKQKLTDPQTLKEYFVISEIIGKPKALRR